MGQWKKKNKIEEEENKKRKYVVAKAHFYIQFGENSIFSFIYFFPCSFVSLFVIVVLSLFVAGVIK